MKEIIEKYKWWGIAIVCILIFFCVKSCNSTQVDQLHGENRILKEQVKKAQNGIKILEESRTKLKDSIKLEDNKRKEEQKLFKEKVLASEERVKKLKTENTKAKDKIKNISLEAVAQELNNTYDSKDAIATTNSIDMKGSMPYQVLETIADANTCEETIKEKDVQLEVKDSLNSSLEKDKVALSLSLNTTERSLSAYKDLNKIQTEYNQNTEKENRKLRAKSFFNKILIPVAGAVGIFIGFQVERR